MAIHILMQLLANEKPRWRFIFSPRLEMVRIYTQLKFKITTIVRAA